MVEIILARWEYGNVKYTINYVERINSDLTTASTTLGVRVDNTRNYVWNTSNILVTRLTDEDKYTRINTELNTSDTTSDFRVRNTSNYATRINTNLPPEDRRQFPSPPAPGLLQSARPPSPCRGAGRDLQHGCLHLRRGHLPRMHRRLQLRIHFRIGLSRLIFDVYVCISDF